jgi:hypothetical protein
MMNDDRDSTQRDCGGAMAVPCRAVPRFGRTSNRLPWDRVSALAMAGQAKTLDLQVHAALGRPCKAAGFPEFSHLRHCSPTLSQLSRVAESSAWLGHSPTELEVRLFSVP